MTIIFDILNISTLPIIGTIILMHTGITKYIHENFFNAIYCSNKDFSGAYKFIICFILQKYFKAFINYFRQFPVKLKFL